MEARFAAKKTAILKQLGRPDDEYSDASPKGSVDESIRDLVGEINKCAGFVTTSSCSGRIAVYLEGAKTPKTGLVAESHSAEGLDAGVPTASTSSGGKGGGRWLFTSHAPVALDAVCTAGDIYSLFGIEPFQSLSFPTEDEVRQFVHLKFEPMILHILCSTMQQAQLALNAATGAGFRESGISSVLDSKGRATPPMVAVRSSGMAFDALVASLVDGKVLPMVSEAYLHTIVRAANDHFYTNEERKRRFRRALAHQPSFSTPTTAEAKAGESPSQFQKKVIPERTHRKEARKAESRRPLAKFASLEANAHLCGSTDDDESSAHDLYLLMEPSSEAYDQEKA